MKRILLLLALGASVAAPARAQVFGQYGDCRPLAVDARLAGAYLQFDPNSIALMSQLRLSFYPGLDFGFQGGLSRFDVGNDSRTAVRVGGDFKAQVAKPSDTKPFALALGAGLGIESADGFTALSIGPTLLATWIVDNGGRLLPYASATLLFTRLDSGAENLTDTSLPLRAGVEFRAMQDVRLLAEVQVHVSGEVRKDFGVSVGANFPF